MRGPKVLSSWALGWCITREARFLHAVAAPSRVRDEVGFLSIPLTRGAGERPISRVVLCGDAQGSRVSSGPHRHVHGLRNRVLPSLF